MYEMKLNRSISILVACNIIIYFFLLKWAHNYMYTKLT